MNLKDMMLSGIRQHRKENTVLSQLYVETTKVQLIKQSRNLIVRNLLWGDRGCWSHGIKIWLGRVNEL